MRRLTREFAANKSGTTAIEYVLIAATMAVVLVAAFPAVTAGLANAFNTVATALNATP